VIKKILFTIFFFLFNLQAFAFEELNFNGFIADNAQIISPQNEEKLNGILFDLQSKTGVDIAVVTLQTLNNEPLEDISLEIARKYKLGGQGLNNGALIIMSLDDRRARIETGYGLEGYMNDSKTGRILDNYMIPYFRIGDYEKGVIQGTLAFAFETAEAYGVELSFKKPPEIESQGDNDIFFIIILIILFLMLGGGPGGMIFLPFGGFRGGGGSGIRFGGGGGFGGGGSTRGW